LISVPTSVVLIQKNGEGKLEGEDFQRKGPDQDHSRSFVSLLHRSFHLGILFHMTLLVDSVECHSRSSTGHPSRLTTGNFGDRHRPFIILSFITAVTICCTSNPARGNKSVCKTYDLRNDSLRRDNFSFINFNNCGLQHQHDKFGRASL
jgi:hypothetical protein